MKEPKFLLVIEKHQTHPYTIYEQAVVGGQVGQRHYMRYDNFDTALKNLVELNGGDPVLLAYSTKPIDNTFAV